MNRIYSTLSIAALLLCASSCSDDDTPLPELKSGNFAGKTLTVTYCGEDMPSKTATFTPDANGGAATIDLAGILDLSYLGMTEIPKLPAPGVLPGSPHTTLKVQLKGDDKSGSYTFSGSGDTDFVTYSYNGDYKTNHLTVNFTDVKLKTAALAGMVFKPTPAETSLEDLVADFQSGKGVKSPFYIDWQIREIPGVSLDPGMLLNALTIAPIVPVYNGTAYSSIAQLFCRCVQTIALLDNGNIPVRYFSSKEGATQLMTTNPTMLQYVVTSQNSIQAYINPMSAIAIWLNAQSKPTALPSFFDTAYADSIKAHLAEHPTQSEADKVIDQAILAALIKALTPSLSNGITMEFAPTTQGINLYLDTKTCTTFIATLLEDLMQQPAVMQRLSGILTEAGLTAAQVEQMLKLMPAFLQSTTTLNIGLSLQTLPTQKVKTE